MIMIEIMTMKMMTTIPSKRARESSLVVEGTFTLCMKMIMMMTHKHVKTHTHTSLHSAVHKHTHTHTRTHTHTSQHTDAYTHVCMTPHQHICTCTLDPKEMATPQKSDMIFRIIVH